MEKIFLLVLILTFCSLILFSSPCYASLKGTLAIKEIGSFFVGGKSIIVDLSEDEIKKMNLIDSKGGAYSPNGTFQTEQMYVNYVRLVNPKAKYALMMWHGGGLTGATYESTPDGRHGWQMFFLKNGHNVYLSDSVERGRSGFSMSPYIYKTQPQSRNNEEMLALFRIGSDYDGKTGKFKPYQGTQFPIEYFEQLAKQGVPRWTDSDSIIYAAYLEYLDRIDEPAVIIAHSQGCKFAMQAAIDRNIKVKSLILLEPHTPLDSINFDLSKMTDIPLLVIYGDNLPTYPLWIKWSQAIKASLTEPLLKLGGNVTWVDLPSVGIKGNGHMLYMEKNSDQIAQFIQGWMTGHDLMKQTTSLI